MDGGAIALGIVRGIARGTSSSVSCGASARGFYAIRGILVCNRHQCRTNRTLLFGEWDKESERVFRAS